MKISISKRTFCIIISLVFLIPLIYSISVYFPGTERIVQGWEEYTDTGEVIVAIAVATAILLTIVWLSVYEKGPYSLEKRKKR